MSETLDPFTCNADDMDEVLSYRLLVTTCVAAGTLYSHRRALGAYTHVIVDEVRHKLRMYTYTALNLL